MDLMRFRSRLRRLQRAHLIDDTARWFFSWRWLRAGGGLALRREPDGVYLQLDPTAQAPGFTDEMVKADAADPAAGYLDDKVQGSVTVNSGDHAIELDGDDATPGADVYYGTDGAGTKGFHALPTDTDTTYQGDEVWTTVDDATTVPTIRHIGPDADDPDLGAYVLDTVPEVLSGSASLTEVIDGVNALIGALVPADWDRVGHLAELDGVTPSGNPDAPGYVSETGLLLWWKLNEGSGTTAIDSSGNGRDGTLQGDAGHTTIADNVCADLDGSGDYIEAPNSLAPGSGDWSLSLWFKSEGSTGATQQYLYFDATGSSGNAPSVQLFVLNATQKLGYNFRDASANNAGGTDVTADVVDDTLHHAVMTWNASTKTARLYLDGSSVDSDTNGSVGAIGTDGGGGQTPKVGASHGGEAINNAFNGQIDDVRIWARELSSTEVASLAGLRA